jgi:hypothetical protein
MMRVWRSFGCALVLYLLAYGAASAGEGAVNARSDATSAVITRHSLKELRDRYVIKQQLDYSCGAAALATLLIYYFGEETSEPEILQILVSGLRAYPNRPACL